MAAPNPDPRSIAPVYLWDLRELLNRAFSAPDNVAGAPVPGGPLPARIRAMASAAGGRAGSEASRASGSVSQVDPLVRSPRSAQYWTLSLPYRVLALGPLLDLASQELSQPDLSAAERLLLQAYSETYQALPLPHDVLLMLRQHDQDEPEDSLPTWLEDWRAEIWRATTIDEIEQVRHRARADVIRRLAGLSWSAPGAALAEVTTDVMCLCRAVAFDVDRARSAAGEHGGSVARAVADLDRRENTTFERYLPLLNRPAVDLEDFAPEERQWIAALAGGRKPVWREGVLPPHTNSGPSSWTVPPRGYTDVSPPIRATPTEPAEDRLSTQTETSDGIDTRALFRSLYDRLSAEIIGRDWLCRDLALLGVEHLSGGSRIRLLLAGPTGAGKSHAARVLAEAIKQPYLRVSMADVTATGWRGADITEIVSGLISDSRQSSPVLVLDELDKVRVYEGSDSNSLQAKTDLMASLLALADGEPVTSEHSGGQVETDRILLIATGAFEGRFSTRPPSTADLVRWGWSAELAARFAHRIVLPPLSRSDAYRLLASGERSVGKALSALMEALNLEVVVPPSVIWYAVDRWAATEGDVRTAAEWLLIAARRRIAAHLDADGEAGRILELTPDDLPHITGTPPGSDM